MSLVHKGIPTVYNGIRFRSRLEAKWASFFDLLKWPWLYEPFDLNCYVPDFILKFPLAPLLVEVKPGITEKELIELGSKQLTGSGWDKEALIVGSCFLPCETWDEFECIGTIRDPETEPHGSWYFNPAAIYYCAVCKHHSLTDSIMHYMCRYSGCSAKCMQPFDYDTLFSKAGNKTQWRGRR
jgi:hypothetical protein